MHRLLSLTIVTGSLLAASAARAQVCHTVTEAAAREAPSDVSARVAIDTAVASIAKGSYAELAPSVGLAWRRLEARVVVPTYHLEYRGVKSDGPGDVLASLSATALDEDGLRAGAALAFTRPTGVEAVGLGMGAPMYMPGAWASIDRGDWSTSASASYGWMSMDAAADGAHHHGPAYLGSLVSPMNERELEGALRTTYRAGDELHVYAGGSIAAPIGLGRTRAFATTGARVLLDGTELSLEIALPIAGDPFRGRLGLGIARVF